ncbi:MAG: NAD-binding protein [Christensenellales bacterium]
MNVIYGDGTDQELLEQEGLQQMDAFVALCDRDEENLMTGLFAVKQGVPKVIVKNNRVAYADIISAMGLDSIVSPKAITCAGISCAMCAPGSMATAPRWSASTG